MRGRDRDDQRGRGEEEAEIGVHAADIHVVRPDHEAQRADRHDRPDHHAVAEDVAPRMGADEVGDDAEGGQRDDVDLGMAEEPEQVLEQDRAAAAVAAAAAPSATSAGMKKLVPSSRSSSIITRADEQRREGQQRHDRRDEDAPDRQRHAHQRHPARARLQHRHHVVQAAHGEADDEQRQRDQHQDDAPVLARRARQDRLRRIERPARAGRSARHEEAGDQHQHRQQVDPVAQHVHVGEHHVPRAEHQRDQVVAEAAEEQRGQQVDHHDHAVHGDELVVGRRRR